jgi:hypothetical protein
VSSFVPSRQQQLAALASAQHGVVARRQLLEAGWPPTTIKSALRSGRLQSGLRGVYLIAGSPGSPIRDLFEVCLAAPGAAVSHRSAWWLLGPRGADPPPAEITTPRWQRAVSHGLIVHESLDLIADDIVTADGLRCTGPARTLIDLGAVLRPWHLERVLDEALASRLVTLDELVRVHRRVARRGRDGVGVIRPLLDERLDRRGGVANHFESRVAKLLIAHGLPAPVHQYPVDLGSGVTVLLDLAWPEHRVCLECDGLRWHTGAGQLRWDNRRQNGLVMAGWTVLRTTYAEYRSAPVRIVATVRQALRAHTAEIA